MKALLWLTFGYLAACGEGASTAVVLELVSNPRINTVDEILEAVEDIEVLLDAEGGFLGLAPGQMTYDGFLVVEADSDPDAELLFAFHSQGLRRLPKGRIDAHENADRTIAVRLRGLAGSVVAVGGIEGRKLFTPGALSSEQVPFNLVNAALPPRVIAVSPNSLPKPGYLGAIAFYTSKPLAAETLTGRVQVRFMGQPIAGSLQGPRACAFGSEMWTFVPTECRGDPNPWLELEIDAGVTDSEGRGLQDYAGNSGFKQRIDPAPGGLPGFFFGDGSCGFPVCELAEVFGTHPDLFCDFGIAFPTPCSVSGKACLGNLETFDWIRASGSMPCSGYWSRAFEAEGQCVFDSPLEDCTSGPCSDPRLKCVQGSCLLRLGSCAPDCREFGGCPEYNLGCELTEFGGHVCR